MYEQFIIHAVVGILTTFIKNPKSSKAQSLRRYLVDLKLAVDDALAAIPDPNAGS